MNPSKPLCLLSGHSKQANQVKYILCPRYPIAEVGHCRSNYLYNLTASVWQVNHLLPFVRSNTFQDLGYTHKMQLQIESIFPRIRSAINGSHSCAEMVQPVDQHPGF